MLVASIGQKGRPSHTLGCPATLAKPALAAAHAAITPSDRTDALNAGPLDPQSPDPFTLFTASAAALLLRFAVGCQGAVLVQYIGDTFGFRESKEHGGSWPARRHLIVAQCSRGTRANEDALAPRCALRWLGN